jgi:23S rRNA-/tRNA-specific pseudouridylate synthase
MNRLPFRIIHEDRDLIVIDKPAGLLTTHTRLYGRSAREAQATAENMLRHAMTVITYALINFILCSPP